MTRSANRDIVRLSNELAAASDRGGAGGLAGKMFAASPPDGHTLMLGESAMMAINPALFADLPYRPLQDFAPVTLLITVPTILVVPSSLGVSGLRDFIALAKSKPGALNYGSGGPARSITSPMAVFAARTGLKLEHIPYRGGTALVNGLMTGEIQAGWSGIPPVKSLIGMANLRFHRRDARPAGLDFASHQAVHQRGAAAIRNVLRA